MSALRSIVFATGCAMGLAGPALAGGVLVPMDNVTVVAFKNPVSTVYVGNSSIAEVTMIDSHHAFVLGKRFGATNLIGLRSDNTKIEEFPVQVSARLGGAVTIFRGANTFNYSCSSQHCETRPVPGDPVNYFKNTEDAATAHEDAGNKAAVIPSGAH
ncbi:MAG TPA: pilus assembly protein N-terminal domain-containing protein [Rhizomicrobium sp.]|nr:pilus assembly protein N-terminal domain-containing protein [Rhizomicrobium sp.]